MDSEANARRIANVENCFGGEVKFNIVILLLTIYWSIGFWSATVCFVCHGKNCYTIIVIQTGILNVGIILPFFNCSFTKLSDLQNLNFLCNYLITGSSSSKSCFSWGGRVTKTV